MKLGWWVTWVHFKGYVNFKKIADQTKKKKKISRKLGYVNFKKILGMHFKGIDRQMLTISRAARASAMATLVMFAGILFFLHRAWRSLLLRLWKSIAIELVV